MVCFSLSQLLLLYSFQDLAFGSGEGKANVERMEHVWRNMDTDKKGNKVKGDNITDM